MVFLLNKLYLLLTLTAALLLAACNNNKDTYKGMSATQIYEQAEKNVAKEKFGQAAKDFEALEARYPYSEYSDKAQLGLTVFKTDRER